MLIRKTGNMRASAVCAVRP